MVLETRFPQNSLSVVPGNVERNNNNPSKKLHLTEQLPKSSINSLHSDHCDEKCETFEISVRDISLKSIKCRGIEALNVEEGKEGTKYSPRKKVPFHNTRIYLSLENEGKTVLVTDTKNNNEKAPQKISKIPSEVLLDRKENQMALWGSRSGDNTHKSKSPKNIPMEEETSHDDGITSPSGVHFKLSLQTEIYNDLDQTQENDSDPSIGYSTKVLKINVGIMSQGQSIQIGTTDLVITGDTLRSKTLDLPIRAIDPRKKVSGLKRVLPRAPSFKSKKQNDSNRLVKGIYEYFQLSPNPTLRVCLDISKPTPMSILHYDMSIEENEMLIKESFGESFDPSENEGVEILHSFNQITILSSFSKRSDKSEQNQDDDVKDSALDNGNIEDATLYNATPINIALQNVPLVGTRTNNSSFSYGLCMVPSSQDLQEPALHKFSSTSKDTTSTVGSSSETNDENEYAKKGQFNDATLSNFPMTDKQRTNSSVSHGLCMTPSNQVFEEPALHTFNGSLKDLSSAEGTASDKDKKLEQNEKSNVIISDTNDGLNLASQTFDTTSDGSSISVATDTNDENCDNLSQGKLPVSISERLDMNDGGKMRSPFGLCMDPRDIHISASYSSDSSGDYSESVNSEINDNENLQTTNDELISNGKNTAIIKPPHAADESEQKHSISYGLCMTQNMTETVEMTSKTFDISEGSSSSVATDTDDENFLKSYENKQQDKQYAGISEGPDNKGGDKIRSPFGLCMNPRDIHLLASYSTSDDEESEGTGLDSNANSERSKVHSLPLQSIHIPTENVIAMIKKSEVKIVQIGGNQYLEKEGTFRIHVPNSLQEEVSLDSSSSSECETSNSDDGASTVNTEDVKKFLCNSSSSSESWESTDDEKNSTA